MFKVPFFKVGGNTFIGHWRVVFRTIEGYDFIEFPTKCHSRFFLSFFPSSEHKYTKKIY